MRAKKDEFLDCTMTSHGFKSYMDGFRTSLVVHRIKECSIRSLNENDMSSRSQKGGLSKTPRATPLKACEILVYLMTSNNSKLDMMDSTLS